MNSISHSTIHRRTCLLISSSPTGFLHRRLQATVLSGLLAIFISCHSESDDVLIVAKQFTSAVQRKDIKTILKITEQSRIDRLEKAAERASDQIGGRRQVEVKEMLQIVGTDSVFAPESFEVTNIQEDRARVLVTGVSGDQFELDMIRQAGLWRIIIPVPAILNY